MGVSGTRGVGEEPTAAGLAQPELFGGAGLSIGELRKRLHRVGDPAGSPVTLTARERRELLRAARALQGTVASFNRTVTAECRVALSPYLASWCDREPAVES